MLYGEGDNELKLVVSHEAIVSATYKLTFNPIYKYGVCESPQDSGYINTGHFNRELDVIKQLYFHVDRDTSGEDYYFHYFLVEVSFSNDDCTKRTTSVVEYRLYCGESLTVI